MKTFQYSTLLTALAVFEFCVTQSGAVSDSPKGGHAVFQLVLPEIARRVRENEHGPFRWFLVPRQLEIPKYSGAGGIFGDFLDCIKTRNRPVRDVEISYRTSTIRQLAGICYELNRLLKWDPDKEESKGDDEANALRSRTSRGSWTL